MTLEKPDLADAKIVDCLRDQYGLHAAEMIFLPRGGDANAALYRVVTDKGWAYFLKLRRGAFDEACVIIPDFLRQRGVPQIIPTIPTQNRKLWTQLDDFKVIL